MVPIYQRLGETNTLYLSRSPLQKRVTWCEVGRFRGKSEIEMKTLHDTWILSGTNVEEFEYRLDIARVTGGGPTLNIYFVGMSEFMKCIYFFCAIF